MHLAHPIPFELIIRVIFGGKYKSWSSLQRSLYNILSVRNAAHLNADATARGTKNPLAKWRLSFPFPQKTVHSSPCCLALVPSDLYFANSLTSVFSNPGIYRFIEITLLSIINPNTKYVYILNLLKTKTESAVSTQLLPAQILFLI